MQAAAEVAVPDRYDASSARCHVFTFKEGVLAAVGHDLRLAVDDFEIELERGPPVRIAARFVAASIRAECAMAGGRDNPGGLSDDDREKIDDNVAGEVLHVRKHPEIRFASSSVEPAGAGYRVQGRLAMHGAERPVAFDVRREGAGWVAEATLHQPDWGIRPFSALLGTLRIRAEVRVRVEVPASPEDAAGA